MWIVHPTAGDPPQACGMGPRAYACICMKRTTILVPDELDSRLRLEASLRGKSVSDIVREALEAYVPPVGKPGPLRFFGIGEGEEPHDVSRRVDEFVAAAIEEDFEASRLPAPG